MTKQHDFQDKQCSSKIFSTTQMKKVNQIKNKSCTFDFILTRKHSY